MTNHDRFARVGRLRRGYHCRQVDAFVQRVEVSLRGGQPPVPAAEIRRAGFELVRHGYDVDRVDRFVDQLEERAAVVQGMTSGRRGVFDPDRETVWLRNELNRPYMQRFDRVRGLRRGYHIDDVDDFVDRVSETLAARDSVTLDDVRTAAFRPQRGGYDEAQVDETLDRVIELMLLHRTAAAARRPPATPTTTERKLTDPARSRRDPGPPSPAQPTGAAPPTG